MTGLMLARMLTAEAGVKIDEGFYFIDLLISAVAAFMAPTNDKLRGLMSGCRKIEMMFHR